MIKHTVPICLVFFLAISCTTSPSKNEDTSESAKTQFSAVPAKVDKKTQAEKEKELEKLVMHTTRAFEYENHITRYRENSLGNIVTDAIVWYLAEEGIHNIDFALINSGTIRAELPQGKVAKKHIEAALPFEDTVYIHTLNGSDLVRLFDYIASINQGSGGFAQISSEVRYTLTYDEWGKNGSISNITIKNGSIVPNKKYLIATNDYLAAGGDGYMIFKESIEREHTSVLLHDMLIEYADSLSQPIEPNTFIDGRIQIVGGIHP